MTTIRQIALAVLCSTFAATFVAAQEPTPKPPTPPPPTKEPVTKEAPKPAAVFVIANVNGKHEVMNKEALDAKNKQAADDHAKAMKAFEQEKKDAEAAGKKFDGMAPKKLVIATVGGEYPSKAAADEALKKIEEEAKKKSEKPVEPPKK